MSIKYLTETLSVIIVPEGQPVFSELATIVSVDDEAGGTFIKIRQNADGCGELRFDRGEWEIVEATVRRMLIVADKLDKYREESDDTTNR